MQNEPIGTDVRRVLARTWREVRRMTAPLVDPVRRGARRGVTATWRGGRRAATALGRGARRGMAAARQVRSELTPRQVLMGGGIVLLMGLIGWERCGVTGCPSVDSLVAFQPGRAPLLLDREGEELGRLRPVDRIPIPLDSVPEHVRQAFVAIEDRRFRSHDGVDWLRVPGALVANLRSGDVRQGFSTITMQLARNVFPDRLPSAERTLRRKLLEIRIAGEIEERFTKDEILELYLNHIYFGDGVRGIRAASEHWFGREPGSLSVAEGALLAALPKGPELYHPRRNPERARERRDLVLERMLEQGMLDTAEAEAANGPLGVLGRSVRWEVEQRTAPYFVEQVRRVLEERFGERLYSVPLRIRTTLDRNVQEALERELSRQIRWVEVGGYGRFQGPRYDRFASAVDSVAYLQGAGVVMDVATGDVLALVGGRDFRQSPFDRAVRSRRQVGSAFKPFVYAAALAAGVAPDDILEDRPFTVELEDSTWTPRNFDGRHTGQVTVEEALVRSLNIPTARLAQQVGTGRIADLAEAAGVAQDVPEEPSMALGTVASSPLRMAVAYSALAAEGVRVEPRFVLSVAEAVADDREEEGEGEGEGEVEVEREREVEGEREVVGEVRWRPQVRRERVMDPEVARRVTQMLLEAVDRGTGANVRRAGFRGPAAGKTGTTTDAVDAWFVGYTPELVGSIWIGFDQPRTIVPSASGGMLAAPVWGRTFSRIHRGREVDATFVEAQDRQGEEPGLIERLGDWLGGLVP